jgi:glyoxylase-like metal-dependent hydrolase (beta-lactamase superfamily II)
MTPEPLDVRHQGVERVVGVYLLDTPDGPALFDTGPRRDLPELEARLAERGLDVSELRHLLLSHIHLDHAGAAGTLVRRNPRLTVHVSEVGAPHVIDPARLIASAHRLYGDDLDRLYGEPEPIPEANVRVTGPRVIGLECFPAPGHAAHHVCYLDQHGTLYAGDAAGVRIVPSNHIVPVAPPPEVDVEAWLATIAELERRAPERLALIHFGVVEDAREHLPGLRNRLEEWSARVASGMSEAEFAEIARSELGDAEDAVPWERAAPLWLSYAGLRRYWDKRQAA